MEKLDLSRKSLRNFGLTMAVCFCLIGVLVFLKHHAVNRFIVCLAAFFLVSGCAAPEILRWVYIPWMRLAELMGAVMSRVILTAVFFIVLVPTSLLLRLMRKDLLNRRLSRCDTYWNKIGSAKTDYERQF